MGFRLFIDITDISVLQTEVEFTGVLVSWETS